MQVLPRNVKIPRNRLKSYLERHLSAYRWVGLNFPGLKRVGFLEKEEMVRLATGGTKDSIYKYIVFPHGLKDNAKKMCSIVIQKLHTSI